MRTLIITRVQKIDCRPYKVKWESKNKWHYKMVVVQNSFGILSLFVSRLSFWIMF